MRNLIGTLNGHGFVIRNLLRVTFRVLVTKQDFGLTSKNKEPAERHCASPGGREGRQFRIRSGGSGGLGRQGRLLSISSGCVVPAIAY